MGFKVIHQTEQVMGGVWRIGFKSEGAYIEGDAPTVPMSRKGDGCYTRIDRLEEHNHHAPMFKTKVELDAYIDRIHKAVAAAAKEVPPSAWVEVEPVVDAVEIEVAKTEIPDVIADAFTDEGDSPAESPSEAPSEAEDSDEGAE